MRKPHASFQRVTYMFFYAYPPARKVHKDVPRCCNSSKMLTRAPQLPSLSVPATPRESLTRSTATPRSTSTPRPESRGPAAGHTKYASSWASTLATRGQLEELHGFPPTDSPLLTGLGYSARWDSRTPVWETIPPCRGPPPDTPIWATKAPASRCPPHKCTAHPSLI